MRPSRRPDPLPIERVKLGFLGRIEVRWIINLLEIPKQQSENLFGAGSSCFDM
jgi:hypothetical protein